MHSNSSQVYIDISDEDADTNSAEARGKEMAALKSQVQALQQENSRLKLKVIEIETRLKATESELGKAVVDNALNHSTTKQAVDVTSSKRPRSPSFELVQSPYIAKSEAKEEPMHSPAQTKKFKFEEASPPQMRGQAESSPTKPIPSRQRPSIENRAPSTSSESLSQSDGPSTSRGRGNTFWTTNPFKQPKVTHGGHNSKLLLKTLKGYRDSLPTLPIHPAPLEARVKREPFAKYYGGACQHFLQYIPEDRNPSGQVKRKLVFPRPDQNPELPVAPGEPGLIYACRHEVADRSPWSLFVKHDPGVAVWTYLGDYKGEIRGKLTPDQFKALSIKEQQMWIDHLRNKKTGVYLTMRIRIALRKQNLIPLEDKKAEEDLIKESKARQSDFKVSESDVRNAFYEGQEGLDIIQMVCVSYDHVFANDIRRNFTESGTRKPRQRIEDIDSDYPDVPSDCSSD